MTTQNTRTCPTHNTNISKIRFDCRIHSKIMVKIVVSTDSGLIKKFARIEFPYNFKN